MLFFSSAVVSMFTLPVVYDKYQVGLSALCIWGGWVALPDCCLLDLVSSCSLQAQIDQYLGLVRTHINTVVAK